MLQLQEIEAGKLKSFEDARAELEDEYRKERAQTIFYDESQKLADTAFSSLTELESVAKTMDLPLKTVKGFTREGGGEFGQERSVIDAAFSDEVLERRENSPLVTIGEDRALILRVTEHKPAEARSLADVRAQIESQLRVQGARDAAAKKGADAVSRLQKGEPWKDVVASMGLSAVGKRLIARDDSVAPDAVKRAAFSAAKSQVSETKPYFAGVVTDDGNYAVLAVTQVRSGDPAAEPAAEKTARQRRVERQTGTEELAAYVAEAERSADIVKNDKVFE